MVGARNWRELIEEAIEGGKDSANPWVCEFICEPGKITVFFNSGWVAEFIFTYYTSVGCPIIHYFRLLKGNGALVCLFNGKLYEGPVRNDEYRITIMTDFSYPLEVALYAYIACQYFKRCYQEEPWEKGEESPEELKVPFEVTCRFEHFYIENII